MHALVANGKAGIIVGTHNAYLSINLDEDKPCHVTYWHPTWEMQYGEMGTVRKMTAGQKRYQEYLSLELDCSFAEWLGVDKESKARREWSKRMGWV